MTNKEKRKRESRLRCLVCGGPLKVDTDESKGPHVMVRYRSCLSCETKHKGTERVELLGKSEEN